MKREEEEKKRYWSSLFLSVYFLDVLKYNLQNTYTEKHSKSVGIMDRES